MVLEDLLHLRLNFSLCHGNAKRYQSWLVVSWDAFCQSIGIKLTVTQAPPSTKYKGALMWDTCTEIAAFTFEGDINTYVYGIARIDPYILPVGVFIGCNGINSSVPLYQPIGSVPVYRVN